MGLGQQFLLLLWKNFTVSRRKICATTFEIVLPVAFALLLLVIRSLVSTTDHTTPSTWDAFSVDNVGTLVPVKSGKTNLYYSPDSTAVQAVMSAVTTALGGNATVTGFSSATALRSSYDINSGSVWAAVEFDETADYSSSLPNDITYSLRVARISSDGENKWFTDRMYELFQQPGYRNNFSTGGSPYYYDTGFLSLQYAIDKAIIDYKDNTNTLGTTYTVQLKKMAYPAFLEDDLVTTLQTVMPLFIMLSFIVTVFSTTKSIVQEKETKLKESMKLMGMSATMYWLSWFAMMFIYFFVISFLFTFLLCVKLGSNGGVLQNSSPLLIFIFLLLFCISVLAFCFMMSTLFSRATSAAFAAGILYYIFYTPQFFISSSYDTMSQGEKMAVSFLNLMAMTMGVTTITLYEGTGEGAQWSNFHQPATPDDNLSLLMCIGMLILDSALYFLVAWYVENINPGEAGVPKPVYFPFMKSYWCGAPMGEEMLQISNEENVSEKFEADPTDYNIGVSIKHLRKEFGRGSNKKVAVADTTLNMYEGQITVLLGHNGAGKTTTMSVLTGFMPPTRGTAIINGCDIRKNIDGVRKSLGLCPQHNILFENLTVEEHLWFFSKLKGCPPSEIKQEIEDILNVLGMQSKRHQRSPTLSGGQKRKLSVGIALIGNSKVVILDEPTSGMDPAARRETWEIFQKYKPGRTMILTTHFMDEADVLGDRIAIMSEGVIKCCGTSLFLKKAYGAGYHLVIVKNKDCDVSKVTSVIQGHIPGAVMESNISAELTYLLPFEESSKFEKLFEDIEARSSSLGLSSFGTSATTMEEVFLKVGEGTSADDEDENDDGKNEEMKINHDKPGILNDAFEKEVGINGEVKNTRYYNGLPGESSGSTSSVEKNKGLTWNVQQFYGMFVKKALHTWRNRVITFVQLSLPVIFVILALLVDVTSPKEDDEPALTLTLSQFGTGVIPTYTLGSSSTADTMRIKNLYTTMLASYTLEDLGTTTFDTYTPNKADTIGVSTFSNQYVIGADFDQSNTFTGYFNGEPFHSLPMALNLMMNTMLKEFAGSTHSITVINYPLPLSLSERNEATTTNSLAIGFVLAFLVLFGMAFLSTSFIIFLIKERSTGAKHLQKVSGVSSFTYWLSTYCWDLINYLIPIFIILIVFAAFQTPAYVYGNRLGIVFLLFLIYGFCCLPFVYLLQFLFDVPSTGMATVTMINLLTGLATLLTVFVLQIPSLNTENVADGLDWFFTVIFPHYCLGQSLNNIYNNYENIKLCEQFNYVTLCSINNTLPCCSGCTANCYSFNTNYLGWESPGILRYIIFMLLQTALFISLILLIEYGLLYRFWYFLTSRKSNEVGDVNILEDQIEDNVTEDSDVVDEKRRIDGTPLDTLMQSDSLIINNIAKRYGNFQAVKGISVGVPAQECFGLLGQNGAGKTTTFKMMTGDVVISQGNAYLNGYDVKQHLKKVQQNLGYCPQFDALIEQMTGREILTMYARLRGIPESRIKETVNDLIKTMMLQKHADKNCEVYSGGNKRKLSTAIALIGDPPFVFLDEPTTGMDPGARRKLWNILSDVRSKGRTLVLTSHSMEECDALCTKIVIMVNGRFVCLGSPQHLKNKFGQGYTLIVRLGTTAGGIQISPDLVKNYVLQKFPDTQVFDNHQGYVHFQIPDANIPLAKVFGTMESVKEEFKIEDYSVHQTTLEQVFLSFTRNQKAPSSNSKKVMCCGIRMC